MSARTTSTIRDETGTAAGTFYSSFTGQSATSVQTELKTISPLQYSLPDASNDKRISTDSIEKSISPTFSSVISATKLMPTELLAEWSGCVTSIEEDGHYFLASLTGIKGEGVKGEEDDATIPISDVSVYDKDLLKPGNFFRLCVMHEISPSGQPRRYSMVVFRRLPAYRKQDLDEAMERGRRIARGLRVE